MFRSVYNPPRVQTSAAPAVRFDEAQLAMFAAQNAGPMSGLKDQLAIEAGKSVTPGVDDSPYIQYAIQALTRSRHGDLDDDFSDGDFEEDMEGVPTPPMTARRISSQEQEMGLPPLAVPETAYAGHRDIRRESSTPEERRPLSEREPEDYDQFRTLSPVSSRVVTPQIPFPTQYQTTRPLTPPDAVPEGPENWIPVTETMRDNYYCNDSSYPPLTYKPRIIRPYSIIIFMLLCILMVVGLIFSATFSDSSDGLTPYPGTMYSGPYFLFRILPQLLGAGILLYAQSIVSTSLRILPFTTMANEDALSRHGALFRPLYPTTFLYPRLTGPWHFKLFSVATWLSLLTIPLLSSVFTCIFVEEKWIWATSQGIAWALVAFYIILIAAAGCLMVFWFGKWTGLMWDVRSIADIIPLLNRSNTTERYKGATAIDSPAMLQSYLQDRSIDRLGYWKQGNMQTGGIWYAVGVDGPGNADPQIISQIMGNKHGSYNPSLDSRDARRANLSSTRHRYLPWCLTTLPLVIFASIAGSLLFALLIVSFLPQTSLEAGFLPLLSAKPGDAAFSAANFLYSFLPSLLGMVLFLLFQGLDQALRMVQPWAELSNIDGGLARKSILADYAACSTPLSASLRAARVGHWRVAVVSLLATLSLGIPILAGGLFMALTTPSGQVRMFPSIPVYGVLLALLFLYMGGLTLLIPRRHDFRLPHDVSTLAGIIALCTAEDLTQDAAFRAVRSHEDLEMRLGVDKTSDPREESVWFFGTVPGKDEKKLSVRRVRRFTEKSRGEKKRRSFMRTMV